MLIEIVHIVSGETKHLRVIDGAPIQGRQLTLSERAKDASDPIRLDWGFGVGPAGIEFDRATGGGRHPDWMWMITDGGMAQLGLERRALPAKYLQHRNWVAMGAGRSPLPEQKAPRKKPDPRNGSFGF